MNIKNKEYYLRGISWFYWTGKGYEFTYIFCGNEKTFSPNIHIETSSGKEDTVYEIDDTLLLEGSLKDKGYPFKGKGYIYGLSYIDNKIFAEIILTSKYNAHVFCECNEKGKYIQYGDVYLPPTWGEDQRKESELLAKYVNKVKVAYK